MLECPWCRGTQLLSQVAEEPPVAMCYECGDSFEGKLSLSQGINFPQQEHDCQEEFDLPW